MRRVLFSLLGISMLGLAVGCCHTHGVCDCDFDDHCYTRQPYIHQAGVHVPLPGPVVHDTIHGPVGEPLPAPKTVVVPPGRTREIPKELPPPVKGL